MTQLHIKNRKKKKKKKKKTYCFFVIKEAPMVEVEFGENVLSI
jgi:hypothetical protein